ncbi:nucleotidyltransferase domain-containing protein [Nitrospira sp. Kam-Ns4a]
MRRAGSDQAGNCQAQLLAFARDYAEALKGLLGEQLVSVVLFGSVARGEAGPYSDIGMLIVVEVLPKGRFASKALLSALDPMVEERLAALEAQGYFPRLTRLIKTKAEASQVIPLYLDMTEDAKLLHDRDEFFSSVLDRLRNRLLELGTVRKYRGQVRYWDLKSDLVAGGRFEL